MINKSGKKNADISFASSDKNSHKTTKQILKFCYQGFNIIFIVYKARSSSHPKGPLCWVSTGIDRLLRLGGGVTTSFLLLPRPAPVPTGHVSLVIQSSPWGTCDISSGKKQIIKPAIIMADKAISKASLTEKKL